MPRIRYFFQQQGWRSLLVILLLGIPPGCRHIRGTESHLDTILHSAISNPSALEEFDQEGGAWLEAADQDEPLCHDSFREVEQLEVEHLIDEVLRANPTLEAAEAGWHAASELYDQATAFADPQFRFLQGPTLFGPSNGVHLWRLQFQQKIPWFGKRALRGEIALSEADAAGKEVVAMRLQLIEAAKSAFYDYQMLETLQELLESERQLVNARLRDAHQLPASDPAAQVTLRQVQLELFQLNRRQEELRRAQRLARGGINLLLHRMPDQPLPRPRRGGTLQALPDSAVLRQLALHQRPDLALAQARLRAKAATVGLAYKEFYPDFEFVGRFDSTWDSLWLPSDANLRPQLGVNVYLPVQIQRRYAAVRQAQAEMRRQRAELDQLNAQVHFEVQAAYDRVEETLRTLAMFPGMLAAIYENILALERLAQAQPKYSRDLETARRQWIKLSVDECETWRDYQQRLAELERLVGGPIEPPAEPQGEAVPESQRDLLPEPLGKPLPEPPGQGAEFSGLPPL